MIGHASIELTKNSALKLGTKLIGDLKTCEDCVSAKIMRKNVKKVRNSKSIKSGERILLNCYSPREYFRVPTSQVTSCRKALVTTHLINLLSCLID